MNGEKKIINSTPNAEPIKLIVKINDEYLSQNCIEKCIEAYNKISNYEHQYVLEIITTREVKEVDPLLIAYFALFKKQRNNLDIILHLHDSTSTNVIAKVGQHKAHAQFTSGVNVFKLSPNESDIIPKEWIVWSDSFMPILYIDPANYKSLFVNKIDFHRFGNQAKYNKNWGIQYQNCRQYLYEVFLKDGDGIKFLTQLAFYKALDNTKILSFYLYKHFHNDSDITLEIVKRDKYQISSLYNENAFNFYKEVIDSSIFNDLLSKPPIYYFIYATLLSSDLLPGNLSNDNKKDFIIRLSTLWNFTQQFVDGLNELAKNIQQHSFFRRGVITGRVYNGNRILELHNGISGQNKIFKTYSDLFVEKDGTILKSFFELNVIDNGKVGVIEKLKSDLPTEDIFKEEREDVELLEKGSINFDDFLNPSCAIILNHQAKRSTAHLGLLIFSKLIQENNGLIRAGTQKLNNSTERDNVLWFPNIEETEYKNDSYPLCSMGTNYHILLPFDPDEIVTATVPIKYELPTDITPAELKDYEDLLNYKIMDFTGKKFEDKIIENERYLFLTNSELKINDGSSRQDEFEFWNDIMPFGYDHKMFIKNTNPKEKSFVCLDLNGIEINSSQLFRLLGRWEVEYSGCPIIIYNISIEIVAKLIETNEYFCKKIKNQSKDRSEKDFPYWGENSIALFYSYIHYKDNLFYFADVLWGNNHLDFLFVNHLIQKTNYNTIIFQADVTRNNDLKNNLKNPDWVNMNVKLLSRFGLFQNGVTLLPFDLLLTAPTGLSLFESNATVLLQKELQNGKEVKL
jgi:hypothetical protein